MKTKIHRGTGEIGGTVIEITSTNNRILLDLGLPLSPESKQIDVTSLKPDAVLISHPHQDHYGLIDQLDDEIPVYMGEIGKELIFGLRKFIGLDCPTNTFIYFEKWKSFVIGDFTITPYLVDHSAVDSYAFLIEAEGKKVFYSGDFRASGNKAFLFEKLLTDVPSNIDLLLMEGTMMRRENSDFPDEASVAAGIEKVLKEQQNISFLISSSQNIDRIVSAVHACQNCDKTFVIDIYTAWVLEIITKISGKTPNMAWDQVRIYADKHFDDVVKKNPAYFGDFRRRLYKYRVTSDELKASPEKFLIMSKMSKTRIMEIYKQFGPVNIIYSQWLGYLECKNEEYWGAESMAAFKNIDDEVNFYYAHTSGHATVDVLSQLSKALNPKKLIPIHTEFPEDYRAEFDNVEVLEDGSSVVI